MSITEFLYRFILLIVTTLLLYYFSNRNRHETMNPLLMLVPLGTFSLCYLFTKVEMGLGIGFGLFAIFSILRFRTRAFNVNVIIFLFSTITLSIMDVMYPSDEYDVLCILQISIVVVYFISTLRVVRYNNTIDLKLEYTDADSVSEKAIHDKICEKMTIQRFAFKIEKIDVVDNKISVKVYY
ncbi:MAG: DUF4956 domain-containing protein [Flavobacterium sp.]|uniref:DUF4956 domain-containing protein n=1 Tax=Flavobacterium sp. TaxID=239 RepID=UPI0011F9200D|nr:DUF4956 domain-containing protein [Flavobacterium sp.]RZJ65175.1 MAG: DUF4956 domain-containing protein [Flavobacterium sp.]